MKTNTALGLALTGAALLLLAPERRGRLRTSFGRAGAALAGLIGFATLTQHLVGWNLGLDEALFREGAGSPATQSPNRMGPPASTAFPLLALAVLLLDRDRGRRTTPAQGFALAAMVVAMVPLLGYLFGVREMYGVARLTGVALHTAIAFMLGGFAVFALRPRAGLTRLVVSDDPGGVLVRRLLPAAAGLPVLLGLVVAAGQRANLFDADFGYSLLIFAFVVAFTVYTLRVGWMTSAQSAARLRAESGRLELRDRLIHVLENISQGFCSLDAAGRVTYLNRETERLTGRRRDAVLGRPLEELFPAGRFPALHEAAAHGVAGGAVVHVTTHDPESGAWLDHDLLRTAQGLTLFSRDVTAARDLDEERRRLLDSERAARAQAEHANRMKDDFLATLSHELRTPLNAILGWASLLGRPDVKEADALRGYEAIERNARLQARLIDDLLDMSRIVSGKIRLDLQRVDLATVVDAVMSTSTPAAAARQIWLERDLGAGAPPVIGDPARLQQVLWNLVSNALKFTPQLGTVRIVLRHEGGRVRLAVRDTGIGIAPEFLPHVFDRFRQADSSSTRRHGGLGLGLAIARQLAEMHHGTITVASDGEGRGAEFVLELPAAPAGATEAVAGDGRRGEGAPLDGVRVLLVEDDGDTRDLIRTILARNGAAVTEADGYQSALDAIGREGFDVLVSDIGMPERDGYALMRTVRARLGPVPAVALTAFARDEDRRHALEAGFEVHLAKPVQPDRLVRSVAELARRQPGPGPAPAPGPAPDPGPPPAPRPRPPVSRRDGQPAG